MEEELSLARFVNRLDQGPRGAEDAINLINECASSKSSVLNLQQMSLTDSDLQKISDHFPTISEHVTTLNLFMNELTKLPESIGTLSNLDSLQAGCNPLQSISESLFQNLPNLTNLDIGFSETLEYLPDTFRHTPRLEVFDAGNNRLRCLPPSLFSSTLQHLHTINVYGNCLKSLPDDIGQLRALTHLNIGRNQIELLPQTLGMCEQLQVLHVYENSLTGLPRSIARLPKLRTLTVHANPDLPTLPREIRAQPGAQASAEFYANLAQAAQSH